MYRNELSIHNDAFRCTHSTIPSSNLHDIISFLHEFHSTAALSFSPKIELARKILVIGLRS